MIGYRGPQRWLKPAIPILYVTGEVARQLGRGPSLRLQAVFQTNNSHSALTLGPQLIRTTLVFLWVITGPTAIIIELRYYGL